MRRSIGLSLMLLVVSISGLYVLSATPGKSEGGVSVVDGSSSGPPSIRQPLPAQNLPVASLEKEDDVSERFAELSRKSKPLLPLITNGPSFLRSQYERLLTERRDEAWASQAESIIRKRFAELPEIGGANRIVDVECGATICQVNGILQDQSGSSQGEAMRAVQSVSLMQSMLANGYRPAGSTFGLNDKGQFTFISYYDRAEPDDSPL